VGSRNVMKTSKGRSEGRSKGRSEGRSKGRRYFGVLQIMCVVVKGVML